MRSRFRNPLRFLALLCLLAFIAGIAERGQNKMVRVPASKVDTFWCQHDGGIKFVMERAENSGVYYIHCADGVVATGGNR